jgi:hypothetical protein
LALDKALGNTALNVYVQYVIEFLDQLSKYQLQKTNSSIKAAFNYKVRVSNTTIPHEAKVKDTPLLSTYSGNAIT